MTAAQLNNRRPNDTVKVSSNNNTTTNNGSATTDTSSGKIRVVARIRPLAKYEEKNGSKEIVTSLSKTVDGYSYLTEPTKVPDVVQVIPPTAQKRWFELDAVFDKTCTQNDVYVHSGAKYAVCENIFKGFHCTILAYGQTGAGKTFTMGTAASSGITEIQETDGVIPRACHDLFANISTKCDGHAKVELSYLEIYNEEIRDLLSDEQQHNHHHHNHQPLNTNNNNGLKIRETLDGEVYVSGLQSRIVTTTKDIGILMEQAGKRRVTASTAMNAVSSRSHAICILKVQGVLEDSSKFQAKLTLVDLAGSERIKKTGAQGNRRMEGININKGLFVLGQVVSALAEQGRNSSNTTNKKLKGSSRKPPYRDSKLTRLLQDSLGGNSRTIMVACVSPADFNVDESVNTLRYATSARNIKNTATRNVMKSISPEEAAKLQRDNQLLQAQVRELQDTIKKLTIEVENASVASFNSSDDDDNFSLQSCDVSTTTALTGASTTISSQSQHHDTQEDDEHDNNSNSCNNNNNAELLEAKEKIIELQAQVDTLKKALKRTKTDLRKSMTATAIELPAMKVQVAHLREEVELVEQMENENKLLHQDLAEAKADADSARQAAKELSDIVEQLKTQFQHQFQQQKQEQQQQDTKYVEIEEEKDVDDEHHGVDTTASDIIAAISSCPSTSSSTASTLSQPDQLSSTATTATTASTTIEDGTSSSNTMEQQQQKDQQIQSLLGGSWNTLLIQFGILYITLGMFAYIIVSLFGLSNSTMQMYTVLFVQSSILFLAFKNLEENLLSKGQIQTTITGNISEKFNNNNSTNNNIRTPLQPNEKQKKEI